VRLRNIATTTTLATAATLLLAAQATAITLSWGLPYWPLSCATGILACTAALLVGSAVGRGRVAVVATVGAMVVAGVAMVVAHLTRLPTEPAPATTLGLAVIVAAAVRRRTPVPATAVAAGGLAVVVASRLLVLPTSSEVIPNLAATGWLVAVAVGLALRLRDARRRGAAEAVRREEHLDLARELHDVVAHHITGIVLQAQAAQLLVARETPERRDGERVGAVLVGIERAGSEALAAMRRVVGVLRDGEALPAGPAVPGVEEFGELVRRFEGQGFVVRVRMAEGVGVGWPPEVTSTAYRIVQEALTNVSRHATRATGVSVVVERGPGEVTVEVTDDAPPAPARLGHRGGYGLVGMRERVETLGGTLDAGPRPGTGWTVRATLPMPADLR
jgi:signal transduction histidine kinase